MKKVVQLHVKKALANTYFCIYFFNSFIEIEFISHKIHPFKEYN